MTDDFNLLIQIVLTTEVDIKINPQDFTIWNMVFRVRLEAPCSTLLTRLVFQPSFSASSFWVIPLRATALANCTATSCAFNSKRKSLSSRASAHKPANSFFSMLFPSLRDDHQLFRVNGQAC